MAELLRGIAAAPGIAVGKAVIRREVEPIPRGWPVSSPPEELARLGAALEETSWQLRSVMGRVASRIGEKEAEIVKTQLLILDDPLLIGRVKEGIRSGGLSAEEAVDQAVRSVAEKFLALKDRYLQERAADIRDVGRRLLRSLTHRTPEEDARPEGGIIIASNLTPSETCLLDPERVLGIVTEAGGQTSHTAILARALNIAMAAGVKGVLERVQDGDPVIVDGGRGEVIVRPDESAVEFYRRRQAEQQSAQEELAAASGLLAITMDGFRVEMAANIGGLWEVHAALAAGAESVGVLRTEFLFLNRETLPSEQEHFEAYREVLSRMAPRRVVVRTLDIGGDKQLPGCELAREPNPALGLRAMRLSLQREELLRTQLRALLRASRLGDLAILLPMVCDVDEVRRTKQIIAGISSAPEAAPLLGAMVETPAAALLTEDLAGEVDFFSIGTNDLTQYVLAVDRLNEQVSHLYQPFHPAVLRLIREVVEAARRNGKRVAICGEMAADPLAAPLLVGLGLDELSMSPRSIPMVRDLVRRLSKTEAEGLVAVDMFAQEGVLQRVAMIECRYCHMPAPRADYQEGLDEDDEYRCTGCDRPLTDRTIEFITTYRRGEKWPEVSTEINRARAGARKRCRIPTPPGIPKRPASCPCRASFPWQREPRAIAWP